MTKGKCSCCCLFNAEGNMEWFQHKSDGRNERRLFDIADEYGRDAYYLYYATCELYAKLYGDIDDDGYITCSLSWLFSQLHIEKGERDGFLVLYRRMTEVELIEVELVGDKDIKIRIADFADIASNWVRRQVKKQGRSRPTEAPLEAPAEAPAEAPTAVEEKRKEEKKEEKNIVADVIDHLNSTAGTSYRPSARESVNHIKGRAKEGATIDDFKLVVDSKVSQWRSDEKMCKYIRPSTLFNSEKFWGYLNEAKMAKTITPKPAGGGYRGSGVAI